MNPKGPPASARRGRKPGTKLDFTRATMGRDIARSLMISLHMGVMTDKQIDLLPVGVSYNSLKFWLSLKKKNPVKYAECLMKLVPFHKEEPEEAIKTFVIQQLNMVATPVPGVLNSPIEAHIQPLKLIANGGEVVDMEAGDD